MNDKFFETPNLT